MATPGRPLNFLETPIDNTHEPHAFAGRKLGQRTPEVEDVRVRLAFALATLPLPLPPPPPAAAEHAPDLELLALIIRLGMWPSPRTRSEALHALAWTGPRLLLLFTNCPPDQRERFDRWQRAITRYDAISAAHWLIRLELWPVPRQT